MKISYRAESIRSLLFLLAMFHGVTSCASPLKSDEQLILFPVDASAEAAGQWSVPFHGWVFEYEEDSLWRSGTVKLLTGGMNVPDDAEVRQRFRERIWMFLVDNERNKDISIQLEGRSYDMDKSTPNGHFSATALHSSDGAGWRETSVQRGKNSRRFVGRVRLLPPQGVSVISDIDDTIKISEVYDKKRLLENTFINPWQAVPGMAVLYEQWAAAGVEFHYVSGSPWQLYVPLDAFLHDSGFPRGSYALRYFRLKDKTLLDMMGKPETHKNRAISELLQRFPGRRFIMVGDSTESDPEIYGAMARAYPEQIAHIFIRNVLPEHADPDRYAKAFRDLPPGRWTVFAEAAQVHCDIAKKPPKVMACSGAAAGR